MSALEVQVYEIFKIKLGEKEAGLVMEFLDKQTEEKIVQKQDVFLVKDDKIELIKQMKEDKVDLIKWMVGFWIVQMAAIVGLYMRH